MKLLERPLRRSSALTVRTSIAGGLALLVIAVGLGMQWPNAWWRSGPGDGTQFDYSAPDARFGSLRDEYMSAVLGDNGLDRPGTRTAVHSGVTPKPVVITHPFTNDDFEHAYNVTGLPFSARTDTTGATRQPAEPTSCFPSGGTAWYQYRPHRDMALFADTFGTGKSTSLGVFTGRSRDSLELVGCDTNVLGNAQVGFRAAKGKSYYFQLTPTVMDGTSVFELEAVGPTTLESLSRSGGPADGGAFEHPDVSADGRYVAFSSHARNLAPNPPPCPDWPLCVTLYLRDRLTGKTTAVAAQGSFYADDGSGAAFWPSLSADGRYLSFSGYVLLGIIFRGPPDADPFVYSAYLYDRVTGRTELVSRNSAGEPARTDPVFNAASPHPVGSFGSSVSSDGRFVVFNSDAANLGGPPDRGRLAVYLRDRVTGTTRLVSTDESGQPNHADNCAGTGRNVPRDGRYVAYRSTYGTGTDSPAGQEAFGDLFGQGKRPYLVYLWDARTGTSRLISKLPPGVQPETLGNYCVSISLDGSHVGFVSRDPLVSDDTNGTPDIYVYEVATGHLERVSVTSAGEQTLDPNVEGEEDGPFKRFVTLSADGRYVVFDSAAPNMAPGAVGSAERPGARPPGPRQVYLHDLVTGATTLASVSSTGEPLPGESIFPYISPDASAVTFMHVGSSGRLEVVVHELR